MNPQQSFESRTARMLHRYLPLLLNTLDAAIPPFPDWWITQTEQFLITPVLCGHRHNYSHLLEQDTPDAGGRAVSQAEEYIEANVQRAITLEELAEATGVSTLTLFRSFKKYRGYSATKFLLQMRARRQRNQPARSIDFRSFARGASRKCAPFSLAFTACLCSSRAIPGPSMLRPIAIR
jgi:hypothetical protein